MLDLPGVSGGGTLEKNNAEQERPSKTRLVDLRRGNESFEFLGCTIRKKRSMLIRQWLDFDIGSLDEITPVLAIPETKVPDGTRAG
jgi:hypothetical protein